MTKEEIKELAKLLEYFNGDCYYCPINPSIKPNKCIRRKGEIFCDEKDWEKYLERKFNGKEENIL